MPEDTIVDVDVEDADADEAAVAVESTDEAPARKPRKVLTPEEIKARMDKRRAYQRDYSKKPQAVEARKRYFASDKAKAKQAAYRQSPENKAKQAAYRQTPEYKAKQAAYRQTPEFKAKQAVYRKQRYQELKTAMKLYRAAVDAEANAGNDEAAG